MDQAMTVDENRIGVIRLAGVCGILSGVVFLTTIGYTFGFLFSRGLTFEMLDDPGLLLPWVHTNTVAFVELWWIFALHLILLLPVPQGLSVIAGPRRAGIRIATTFAVSGAIVGMTAAMVNAATAPVLGTASMSSDPTLLASARLTSLIAGSLGLHLRLLSYLLLAIWFTVTGLTFLKLTGWRAVGTAQLFVAGLTLVVVIAKPFDWIDLEPSLGFAFALVYIWIGMSLLKTNPSLTHLSTESPNRAG